MRTTITLSDAVGELAQKMADIECRGNFSHLCEKALSAYCKEAQVDVRDQIDAAITEVGPEKALKVLRSAARRKEAA